MTSRWQEGTVVELPFEAVCRLEPTPARLSMTCVLHGQPPIDISRPLTWIELGCGHGMTALAVAAAHPQIEVWACDLNPVHVEHACGLARRAGLANITFELVSFDQVAKDRSIGPRSADVVVVDSVHSWVSLADRRNIAAILADRLVPGGLAYVSANNLAGWSDLTAIRELMLRIAQIDRRPIARSIADALDLIDQLEQGGARIFPLGGKEGVIRGRFGSQLPNYLAHEYLNVEWHPMMFAELAAEMAEAGCAFVGTSDATSHVADLRVPAAHVHLIEHEDDVVLRETLVEFATCPTYSGYVFRRGAAGVGRALVRSWQDQLTLVRTGVAYHDGMPVDTATGPVSLPADLYGGIIDALDRGPVSTRDIAGIEEWRSASARDVLAAFGLLVAAGVAAPVLFNEQGAAARDATARLNRVLADDAAAGLGDRHLISPVMGAGVELGTIGVIALQAIVDGEVAPDQSALVDHCMAWLARLDQPMFGPSGALDGEDLRSAVASQVEDVLRCWPTTLENLGIGLAPRAASPD